MVIMNEELNKLALAKQECLKKIDINTDESVRHKLASEFIALENQEQELKQKLMNEAMDSVPATKESKQLTKKQELREMRREYRGLIDEYRDCVESMNEIRAKKKEMRGKIDALADEVKNEK